VTNTVDNTVTQVENTIPGAAGKTRAIEATNGIVPGVPGTPGSPRAAEVAHGAGHGKSKSTEVADGAGHGKSRAPEETNEDGHGVGGPESPVGHVVDETVGAVGDLLHPHH
jgi:hypothetical protein